MEGTPRGVFNEPQPDGTVIQYDNRGKEIARFESDEACLSAMNLDPPSGLPTVGEEIRDGISALAKASREAVHEMLGERPHAA
jgi:hypothetical protein